MKPQYVAQYRRRLEALNSRVQGDKSALAEQSLGDSGREAELSNAPMHLADMGAEEFQHELNAVLLQNESNLSDEIAAALQRIDDGSFGTCAECGAELDAERLDAIPFARYCVRHAEHADGPAQVNLNDGRPTSPRETLAPIGEMEEDRRIIEGPHDMGRRTHLESDRHAVGTPGGGSAYGGLAGGNSGGGEPRVSDLQRAAGNGEADHLEDRDDDETPQSGRGGGAVGGTPARKRAK